MATTFRPITLDDVETIVEVLCAVSKHEIPAEDFRHDALEQARGEIPNSVTYVICSDETRVGRLRLVRVDDYIEIAGLQIHTEWQSKGIGTSVINAILDEACCTGVAVELDVNKDNHNAERLYVRLGFRRAGEGEKDYRMRNQPAASAQ